MGMFDYINYECKCPVCDHVVNGFQSKDGECMLEHIQPEEVDIFYSGCDICKTSITFNWKTKTKKKLIMTTQPDLNKVKKLSKEDMIKYVSNYDHNKDDYYLLTYCIYKLMPLKRR